MPPAEVEIDEELVRRLLAAQHPDLADRPLALLASGWDNVLYRLGDDLLVRLPRRQAAVDLIRAEQRWLPMLAPRLPLPIPVPVRIGTPDGDYPWPWSVGRYLPGASALAVILDGGHIDHASVAATLGRFCAALHTPADDDAPHNPFRGIPLADRDAMTRQRIDQVESLIDTAAALELWERSLATPAWAGAALWLHGDLHPGNLVVDDGRITAVIDFGDITSGDPATDLAVAWMLFPPEHRPTFRTAAGPAAADDDTWARARGWALALGLAILASSADNPAYHQLATRTLAAVFGDPR